ncbi:MAG: hypothetical protein EXR73_08820 [Myxococcales bacterium]|nr:hypothetical protein [Myxococcales bacterium]
MTHCTLRSPAALTLLAALAALTACGGGTTAGTADAGTADAGIGPGPDAATAPPDYARLFPDDRIIDVDLTFADADWATLMADPLADVYVPARLTWDGIVLDEIAVRFKGNSSRNSIERMDGERYSMKLDLDEYVTGQRLLGLDKLNLNNGFKDPSCLRERIGTSIYRAFDVPTSRTAFVRLTKNGVLFGLYLAVEQVEADFLRAHFADATGALYKPEMPDGDLVYRGGTIDSYPGIEVKSDPDTTDHTALIALLDVLAHAPAAELEAQLEATLDVEGFLRYLAVTTALVSLDSYQGSAHNYYLYEDKVAARIVVLPWDTNETFGNFSCMGLVGSLLDLPYDAPICGAAARRPLVMRVLAVPAFLARYEALLAELIAGPFAPATVAADVQAQAALIRDDVAADPTRFYPLGDFDTNVTTDLVQMGPMGRVQTVFGLTSFVERRAAALTTQLP